MGRNIVDKIWDAHIVHHTPGHPAIFGIDLILLHEVTSAQAFEVLKERKLPVWDTERCIATLDHSIPTRSNRFEIFDNTAKIQVETLRENCKQFGVPIFDFDSGQQGIVHIIGPELGATQPGMTIVCGDSHTSTHGAFGALAFGIGTSEVSHVLATGCLLLDKPKSMRVTFSGKQGPGVFAKDLILKLISRIGVGGANGHVIEYCGEAIYAMRMDERMTICNMSIECGARAGLVSPDKTTADYLRGRRFAPNEEQFANSQEKWLQFASDADAKYDQEIEIDLTTLEPMVTWGTNPSQTICITGKVPEIGPHQNDSHATKQALDYIGLTPGSNIEGVPVDWAFIGSCTNGRIEDLRIAAKILANRKVNPDVTFYIVPGSEAVLAQAKAEQLDRIFAAAGAQLRMPGCSMCLGMNDDKVPAGKRCISSSNRNFVGRQGPGSRTHLASPATVAASAVAGYITSPVAYL